MTIEIWWDPVCPWCHLGKLDLDAALPDLAGYGPVVWRAFQLDPQASTTPGPTAPELMAGYEARADVDARFARLGELAARHGVTPALATARPVNTLDAHRTALMAQDEGRFDPLADAMLRAYHVENRDIAAHDVLVGLAAEAGLDRTRTVAMLGSDRYVDRVLADRERARRSGVGGVPSVAVDGVLRGDLREWIATTIPTTSSGRPGRARRGART